MQHLLSLDEWTQDLLGQVLRLAAAIKQNPGPYKEAMHHKTLWMMFEKPSLRTRVSFETAMTQMGGHAIYYDTSHSPLNAGKETIADTVKTVSRYVDIIAARLFEHDQIKEMVRYSEVPVINALTNFAHPCQILADLVTILEHKRILKGCALAYLGDAHNNVTHSLLYGCTMTGMHIRVGCPPGKEYRPDEQVVRQAKKIAQTSGSEVRIMHDPIETVKDADVVYTDSWMSYHIEPQFLEERVKIFQPYQVDGALMKQAAPAAIFMNCLPALRGYEQTAEVIDGPQSVVFDQAENRLHAQKAVIITLLGDERL